MRPDSDRDTALLWDMLAAAREALAFISGVTFEQFATNTMMRYAIERQVAVIGEVARQLSSSFKQSHLEIQWDALISRRNLIIHDYGDITFTRLWRIVTVDMPKLIAFLESLAPPLE